jgi:hypothetical protein
MGRVIKDRSAREEEEGEAREKGEARGKVG